ncbi:hypothetical protein [Nocardiopsis deserti]|uniref:hypothetical protein n=1 Tax=Nocardiopsis deserti TaxID=2605988 RepID=UPI00123BBE9F|nr:hypothetical protein [Nocardiopsis deserti]
MANCPVCSRQDRTAKVSAVVREGTTITQSAGSSTIREDDEWSWLRGGTTVARAQHSSTSYSQSTLAAQLSFPAPPGVAPGITRWIGIALLVLAAPLVIQFGVFGVVPAAATGLVLRWLLGWEWKNVLIASAAVLFLVGLAVNGALSLVGGVEQFVSFLFGMGVWTLAVGAGTALVLRDVRSADARRKRDAPLRARAWRIWQRLYFCFRDDLVFDPASGAHGPPTAVRWLIGYPGES